MLLGILLLVSTAVCATADELRSVVDEQEFKQHDHSHIMHIIPAAYPQEYVRPRLSELVDKDKKSYKKLKEVLSKKYFTKAYTFNIYDDDMRKVVIALFYLLKDLDNDKIEPMLRYVRPDFNNDIFDYALRLASLHTNKFKDVIRPPFIEKPNHFVNAEIIRRATMLKINHADFAPSDPLINQYYRADDIFTMNANYSGWNLLENGCDREINYFKEDIGLNSYYYGVHLLHPFWMSNDDLDQLNPRHAEHYYFTHKQLMARYNLEKLHLNKTSKGKFAKDCNFRFDSYNSYLVHDNGLPFPIRIPGLEEWTNDRARVRVSEIAIKEFISRGLMIVQNNGSSITKPDDYNVDLLAKIVRANLDAPRIAKIIRSIYPYGGSGYPMNKYNPAPSLLHYPHTSLRDDTYWHLIQNLLGYFTDYIKSLELYSLTEYEYKNFAIIGHNFTKITTHFDYYQFSTNKVVGDILNYIESPVTYAARQRRLTHLPFTLNFTVESNAETDVIVRLFLGPECDVYHCWYNYTKFFELDAYRTSVKYGENVISWSPETSDRYSSDDKYNLETSKRKDEKEYNMFKFPKTLAIPRGLKNGLNMTLFVMITNADPVQDATPNSNYYKKVMNEVDKKPLGFPFHRQAIIDTDPVPNYKFYNITIYHEHRPVDASGYFSANLY